MGKTIAGAILILTAAILFMGQYLNAAILSSAQIGTAENMSWILISMSEYMPYPVYLSLAALIAGAGLMVRGAVEETLKARSVKRGT
ncbi:hypothetical protein [Alteribacter natronophilus]|uniref:hypothetical protein n=1 Tax=Alteribacter natronophilus TaxID=2583810 RepID=UPI00110ECEA6|nr:hypothetical protein [Alteribacter natronophilus]TMW70947.1 hypothetical protein FGB90_13310 [Alteribacter natronophilus]